MVPQQRPRFEKVLLITQGAVEDALHVVCCSSSSVQLSPVQPDVERLNIAGEKDVRDAVELVKAADDRSAITGALVMGNHVIRR